MGFLIRNPFSSKEPTQRLPVYERLPSPPISPSKERYSTDDDYTTDGDDSDDTDFSRSSTLSSRGSRQTSGSHSSSSLMLPKRPGPAFHVAQRSPVRARRHLYRLPNRVIRYLCLALISTIILFILSLVRASQVENERIATGQVEKVKISPPLYESFDFLTRYYGGVKTLVAGTNNIPQYPSLEDEQPLNITEANAEAPKVHTRPDDHIVNQGPIASSKAFVEHAGSVFRAQQPLNFAECFLDKDHLMKIPPVRYYDGRPNGMPQHVIGSYEMLSLPDDLCFDRYGRYGPYGFGYSVRKGGMGLGTHGEKEGAEAVWSDTNEVDYRGVNWADAQRRCFQANVGRFSEAQQRPDTSELRGGYYISADPAKTGPVARDIVDAPKTSEESSKLGTPPPEDDRAAKIPRTAIVVRCWDEYVWREEDRLFLRSLISELALASGSRYEVHLLVQVKNEAKYPIWADDEIYQQHIKESVPEEFQGLVTLWTETQMLAMYQGVVDLFTKGGDLPVHGVYRGLQMAMQWFAYKHAEYDYFWHWEMDIRYTSHYYDLFAKMEKWAQDQPRKGLWERNARFYVPDVHGSWDDFRQTARVQTEMGTTSADDLWNSFNPNKNGDQPAHDASRQGETSVWGPVRPADSGDWFEHQNDPTPPSSYDKDKYVWGVGEEADLITLNPIFNPEGTTWGLANDITGFNETDGKGKPPRRAHIISASRMSRRLLLQMHRETALKKHHAFPEMWPATVALHHGLKAVYVPHPVYVDREWPVKYLAQTLNNGRNGASGGSRLSVFGAQREHNLKGLSWFYNAGFAPNLYRRWLGLKVNNDGGEEFEIQVDQSKDDSSVANMRGGEGRMCLPPMLLHPIKDVELPVEVIQGESVEWEHEMDPSA